MSDFEDEGYELSPEQERSLLRFMAGAKTIDEVLSSAGPDWLIEGWLATSATMVTGLPESGKSTLVASMAAAVANGDTWLGAEVRSERSGPVLVIVSDPSDISQWAKKGSDLGMSDGAWELINFDRSRWDAYVELAAEIQPKLLVFDNITSALEEGINEANPRSILGPLTRLLDTGTPVVVIHHSGKDRSKDPMGPTAYQAWRRHGIHVAGKGEQRTLTRAGNLGTWASVTVRGSELGSAIQFQLDGEQSTKRNRSPERLDDNASMAKWVVANCQGVGVNETGKRLAQQFGGKEGSRITSLKPRGSLYALLERTGEGGRTAWRLKK